MVAPQPPHHASWFKVRAALLPQGSKATLLLAFSSVGHQEESHLKPRALISPALHHPLPKLQSEINFLGPSLLPAWVGSTCPAQLPNLSVRIWWPVGNSWMLVASWLPQRPCPPDHILMEEKETRSGLRIRVSVPQTLLHPPRSFFPLFST